MQRTLFGAAAGMALLASVGVANAGERATLTDTQLDSVVAGNFAMVEADGLNVAASGTFFTQANTMNASAAIVITSLTNVGTGTPNLIFVSASAGVP
jgi:hypothetical protein